MYLIRLLGLVFLFSFATLGWANSPSTSDAKNSDELASRYFEAWIESQQPSASMKDIEHLTSFMTDDVAWQHSPYAKSDDRTKGGKEKLQAGMMQWLGSHQSYSAELLKLHSSKDYFIIEFRSTAMIKDGNSNQLKELKRHYLDILEMDGGRVAIIRRYDIR
jgi:ketosteroid isomerase-like protein